MENIRVGLVTKDKDYGKALGLALIDVYRNFTVTLYQSAPLHNELDRMDIILFESQEELVNKGKYIQLVEKQSQIDKDYDQNTYKLYKYSNVRALAGELLFIYTNITGRKAAPIRNSSAKIVLFGSVEGGAGCTSAAMAFSQEMSRFHGKKVMYITLEEIESTMEYIERKAEGKNISEYLYYLFNDQDDQHFPFLESFTVIDKYGVEAFLPSSGRNVLNSLSKEEMQYFISAVLDTGAYDVLVIDASNNIGKAAITCYEMANNICMVSIEKSIGYREERFLEYFTFLSGERILDRIGKVINRTGKECVESKEHALRVICTLPEDPDSFDINDGMRSIKPDGKFGENMRLLTNAVIKNIVC